MKTLIVTILACLALTATAQAAPSSASNCRNWQTAQNGSGTLFTSRQECVRSRDAWAPSLSVREIGPMTFQITGEGFHPGSLGVWAPTGVTSITSPDGTVGYAVRYLSCGLAALTFTDGYGVWATIAFQTC